VIVLFVTKTPQKMGFRKVIVCLLLFGVAVLLVQMLALSSLSETLARLPWETEEEGRKTTKEEVRNIQQNSISSHIQQTNAAKSVHDLC
jgi:hypothetical protein